MLAGATQLLWLTFAPLTTASAHRYHVSETAIGLLAEIFPLLYVVLALPAGRLLDRAFHRWLAVGAVLTALGGLARLVAPDFAWALLGQLLVAVAQPLVLNAVTKVASEHLPPRLRPHGIAVGSAGIFLGMLLALTLGTLFGGAHLRRCSSCRPPSQSSPRGRCCSSCATMARPTRSRMWRLESSPCGRCGQTATCEC